MENWKEIEGYEGYYEVSDHGRVRSLERTVEIERNGLLIKKRLKGRVLKQHCDKDGYKNIGLYMGGKIKTLGVHRLVARAFCEGYSEGLMINHKDEDKANNTPANLEWCTAAYNNAYGTHSSKVAESNKRKVAQYTTEGYLVAEHESVKAAYIAIGVPLNSGAIARCCKGKVKTAYGFVWRHF